MYLSFLFCRSHHTFASFSLPSTTPGPLVFSFFFLAAPSASPKDAATLYPLSPTKLNSPPPHYPFIIPHSSSSLPSAPSGTLCELCRGFVPQRYLLNPTRDSFLYFSFTNTCLSRHHVSDLRNYIMTSKRRLSEIDVKKRGPIRILGVLCSPHSTAPSKLVVWRECQMKAWRWCVLDTQGRSCMVEWYWDLVEWPCCFDMPPR